MKAIFKALLLCLLAAPALAQEPPACRDLSFEETSFTVCEAALGDDIRLWLRDNAGALIGTPERLAQALAPDEQLVFAMNAGMYSPDRSPVGLYIEDYQEKRVIVTSAGPGNFGMLPNGLFCLGETLAIYESRAFAKAPVRCRYATQSGPMLVIDGALHPKFIDGSDSLNIRNGVGVSADGQRAVFAISNEPVSFHQFARLFRDALGLPNALYLDGSISRLIAPELGRADIGLPMGPIIGVVAPR
ncbi:phosphodiester glycosidase family protein [Pseudothioclava arenosa]|uniref:Phosphodiester glycosidase domain-containing protein n=1 Tax=Pseudothioclava arenosa TaxID=1795308 RepID=A0A2A4CQH9_9RHOB|nr:phosphodiester glycosidase family protein [Pseudothioclava arenosa]PCD76344.1 hypothetical protein CLN94_09130 [Pseudothioclava arenosa]